MSVVKVLCDNCSTPVPYYDTMIHLRTVGNIYYSHNIRTRCCMECLAHIDPDARRRYLDSPQYERLRRQARAAARREDEGIERRIADAVAVAVAAALAGQPVPLAAAPAEYPDD